jgi:fibronectin type 3 domain-containing protein
VAGEGQVRLEWTPPARLVDGSPTTGEILYEVLRAPAPDAPAQVVTPEPVADTRLTDRGLENDRTYYYAVRAVRREAGTTARGGPSERVAATPVDTTPPAPPRDLVAVPAARTVRLSWRGSPDPDVAAYVVYRAGPGGDFERVGSVHPPATVFVDRDVPPGTWRYAVTALDAARRPNESARSNVVTVTVP